MKVTPSAAIGSRPCTRVFVDGHTFRLAKGDTHIAVWHAVYLEQRRALIVKDNPILRDAVDGQLPIEFTIKKPDSLDWADTKGLTEFARRCVAGVARGRP